MVIQFSEESPNFSTRLHHFSFPLAMSISVPFFFSFLFFFLHFNHIFPFLKIIAILLGVKWWLGPSSTVTLVMLKEEKKEYQYKNNLRCWKSGANIYLIMIDVFYFLGCWCSGGFWHFSSILF